MRSARLPVSASAAWLHDQGERRAAWNALTRAQRATPNDPALAGLELSLLASERNYDKARERAGYWLRRLEKLGSVPDEALDLLREVRADPQRALADLTRDAAPPAISNLLNWIERNGGRPIPDLEWTSVSADADDETMRDAHEPVPRAGEEALVEEWQACSGLGKPFSVSWMSGDEADAWLRSDDWLPWLDSHPEALDSFDILDDLITLLFVTEEATGLLENPWVGALIDRGVTMLLEHWPEDRPGRLPWLIMENRPPLRILSKAVMQDEDGPDVALMRAYLRLNPGDNHGFRGPLINGLLKAGDDAEALKLAEPFADDGMADIIYGRALALYRTGRKGDAVNALVDAAEHLPLVLDYLIRDHVAKPRIDPTGIIVGGKDEAWLYRDAMRDTWLATEGMLGWLKELAKSLKSKRRI